MFYSASAMKGQDEGRVEGKVEEERGRGGSRERVRE
jgi:hypothetical protein